MSTFIAFYVDRINRGKATIDDVPAAIREDVAKLVGQMERLWNHSDPINWRSVFHWGTMTAEEIAADPDLCSMMDEEIILITDGAEITYDYRRLEDWKQAYGVTETDPQKALDECIAIRNRPELSKDDLVSILSAVTGATMEQAQTVDDLAERVELYGDVLQEILALQLGGAE